MNLYGKKGLYLSKELIQLMEKAQLNGVPVLVNRQKMHENLAIMSGSKNLIYSEQLDKASAEMNVKVQKKTNKRGFNITRKITRRVRVW